MFNGFGSDTVQTTPDYSQLKQGYATDGDPVNGILPTLPSSAWFNMITAELCAVCTMFDVELDKLQVNQVATAILKKIQSEIGKIDYDNFAKLDSANMFEQINTFNNGLVTNEQLGASDKSTKVPSTSWVEDRITNLIAQAVGGLSSVPKGFIMMSAGALSGRNPIPLGGKNPLTDWVICDGGSDENGGNVPDLRDRFIVGAGSSYSVKNTGGSNTHSHSYSSSTNYAGSHTHSFSGSSSGSVGSATLSVSQMPSHTHGAKGWWAVANGEGRFAIAWNPQENENNLNVLNYTGSGYSHSHSLSGVSVSGSTGSDGNHYHSYSGSTNSSDNRPLYYALYFVMKVK